jgi:hypothetical protein
MTWESWRYLPYRPADMSALQAAVSIRGINNKKDHHNRFRGLN